ncbi:MAG: hypothetical protein ACREQM_04195 [Candidatus Dormibacteraceae bacterium]
MPEGRTAKPGRRPRLDGLTAPYVLLLAVGVISLLVILLAFGELIEGTAPWTHVDTRATVQGVYRYDPAAGTAVSRARRTFHPDQAFAGRVEWSSLPGRLQVGARWYDSGGEDWGGVQPAPASVLAGAGSLVPMARSGDPPGVYTLDVMRYSAGRPVQILGTVDVTVKS